MAQLRLVLVYHGPFTNRHLLGVALRHLLSLGSTCSCSFLGGGIHHEKPKTSEYPQFSNRKNTSAQSGSKIFQPATVLLKTRFASYPPWFSHGRPIRVHQGPSGSSSSHSLHRRLGKGVLCIFDKGGDLQELQNRKAISPWESSLEEFPSSYKSYTKKKTLTDSMKNG